MPDDPQQIWQSVVGVGMIVGMMTAAVKWLDRDRSGIIRALNAERAAFNEERNARIDMLERASQRCSEDRMQLHVELQELQREVRKLYEQRLDSVREHERNNHA